MLFKRARRHTFLASAVPWFFVGLDLKTFQEIVKATEKVDHRHQFDDCFIVQPQLPHRGSVDMDSILTTHDGGHRNCDDLLGHAVQFPGVGHDYPNLVPVGF